MHTCNYILESFFENLWPSRVKVPIHAYISDKRVTRCNNTLTILSWTLAVLTYFFIFKSYQTNVNVATSSNAWMDASAATPSKEQQKICNNKDYDYSYSEAWTYKNNACDTYELTDVFRKGLAPEVWWVNTYFMDVVSDLCSVPPTETRQECLGKKNIHVSNQNTFVLGVEDYPLTVEVNVNVPRVGFTKKDSRSMDVYVVTKSGLRNQLPATVHTGSTVTMTVKQWLEMAGTTIDAEVLGAGSKTSVGKARHRMIGMGLNIHIEITNTLSTDFFTFPSNQIVMLLYLEVDDNWHRATEPIRPTLVLGRQIARDSYGIRIRTLTLPSQVSIWHIESIVTSLFDIVIFFQVMKVCIRTFAFFALGKSSIKWRNSVGRHVDDHMVLALGVKRTNSKRTRDHEDTTLLLERVKQASLLLVDPLKVLNPTEQVQALFDILDTNQDGKIGILELEELLKKLHFECEEHTADHLMHILDPEHVGYLGRKEIAKYILLEHNKTNKVLVTKSTTLKSSVKVEVSSAGQEGSTQVPYT